MKLDHAIAAWPIQQVRIPGRIPMGSYWALIMYCTCGGRLEVYATDLGYCRTCGAEYFILKAPSRHDHRAQLRFTGRYMR